MSSKHFCDVCGLPLTGWDADPHRIEVHTRCMDEYQRQREREWQPLIDKIAAADEHNARALEEFRREQRTSGS